jgi:tetratricopeptide (TPR) repeat protein
VSLERGRLRNSNGDPAASIPHFRDALGHSERVGDTFLTIDALHMLAIADTVHAGKWTRQGLALAEAATDPRPRRWRGPLHNNLGWTLHEAGDFPAALEAFRAALAAFEETGTPEQVHIARWTIARCLRSLGRNPEALAIQVQLAIADPPDPYVDEEIALLRDLS